MFLTVLTLCFAIIILIIWISILNGEHEDLRRSHYNLLVDVDLSTHRQKVRMDSLMKELDIRINEDGTIYSPNKVS